MMRMMKGRAKAAPCRYYVIAFHITLLKRSLILFFNINIVEKQRELANYIMGMKWDCMQCLASGGLLVNLQANIVIRAHCMVEH